jgi:hypothetical protein
VTFVPFPQPIVVAQPFPASYSENLEALFLANGAFSFCAPAQADRSPLLDISAQHREATMRLLHHPAAQPAGKQHSRHAVNPCIFHTYAQTSIQALCLHTLAKRTKVKPFILHTYKIDRGGTLARATSGFASLDRRYQCPGLSSPFPSLGDSVSLRG